MQYKQLKDISGQVTSNAIQQTDDSSVISTVPNDPKNRDWIAYQSWLSQGNTPEAAE
jgi:hypothetical protein